MAAFDAISDELLAEAMPLCGDDLALRTLFKQEYCARLKQSRMHELLKIQDGTKTREQIRVEVADRIASWREEERAN